MHEDSRRWHKVNDSSFQHEIEGLHLLSKVIPDAEPYRVWTNFEFQDSHGYWYEVDALVVGRRQIHLLELKAFSGELSGDEHSWYHLDRLGQRRTMANPNKTARRKAQRLASRLSDEFRRIIMEAPEVGIDLSGEDTRVPWVQNCVFLTNKKLECHLSQLGRQNVFGPDGDGILGLDGMSTRLLEAPLPHREISPLVSQVLIETAMDRITRPARSGKALGNWEIGEVEDELDNVKLIRAHKADLASDKALLRVVSLPPNTNPAIAKSEYRIQEKEYLRLRALKNDHIDSPVDFFSENDSIIMVFPRGSGNWVALDLLYPGLRLNAQEQVELISQIADALEYAHSNNLIHRNLGPDDVLIDIDALDPKQPSRRRTIRSMVRGWTASGASEHSTQTLNLTVLAGNSTLVHDDYAMFLPPEGYEHNGDKRLGDLFSLGALAYFILSGGSLPAASKRDLIDQLSKTHGLDLATTGSTVEQELRLLVKGATSSSPAEREKAVRKERSKYAEPNPVRAFRHRLKETTEDRVDIEVVDPFNPALNSVISDRFKVEKILGLGSTARGLLVRDLHSADGDPQSNLGVLKVAVDTKGNSRLREEAAAIQELHANLPENTRHDNFVRLLDGPLHLTHERTALYLSSCGERTLDEVMEAGGPSPRQYWNLGSQLLDRLVALEASGVVHRDIKPSNLGLVGKQSEWRLTLFDFSSAHDPLEATEVGTPQYRDPFLGMGRRRRFDSYAERFSVAVVLYQMATHELPVYSVDGTLPELTGGSILLDSSLVGDATFSDEQQEALADFLRDNLDRETARRADSAEAMKESFLSIQKLGNGQRHMAPRPTPSAKRPPTSTPDNPVPITGLGQLLDELKQNAGTKDASARKYLTRILGLAESSPAEPFATNPVYAPLMKVTVGRISQLAGTAYQVWYKSKSLEKTYVELAKALNAAITNCGGLATMAQLNPVVSELLGDDIDTHSRRHLEGVIRLMQLSLEKDPKQHKSFSALRRGRQHIVVALSSADGFDTVPAALENAAIAAVKASAAGIVSSSDLVDLLARAAAEALGVSAQEMPLDASVLPELATHGSGKLALTPAGDLYRVDMSVEQLVSAVFPRTAKVVTRNNLHELIRARFPKAENHELPKHPELDILIREQDAELTYDARRREYKRKEETPSYVETRLPTSTTFARVQAEAFDDLAARLAPTIREREFRVIAVPLGTTAKVVGSLEQKFDVSLLDVSGAVLNELDKATTSKQELESVLNTKNAQHERMLGQMIRTWSKHAIDQSMSQSTEVTILTDVSILADYNNLDLLYPYLDITDNSNPHAVWVVVPQEENSSDHGVLIEGAVLPLTSPDQFVKA